MPGAPVILLIEDDPAVARSLQDGLTRYGFTVNAHATGASGLAFARTQPFHLIILDVRLPDGSGFEVCRALRRQGARQPLLMLTVQSDEIDKVLGLEMGADDYMTKPYSLHELLARVRALLRRAYGELAAGHETRLYIHDLVLDLATSEAWRGEPRAPHSARLPLTPLEFKLLAYLAQNPGQALTRAQILQAVWGYDAEVESDKSVNVHIRRLREKIEHDPSRPALLLTVPGVGYRLVTTL